MAVLRLVDSYTYQDILRAYLDCRRRKRGTRSSVAFEVDFERNLLELLEEVNSGVYQIDRTRVFAIHRPKPREIWAAKFRDRIVHHLIYNDIGAWYEARFIEDTFSCIKSRGTSAASKRLAKFCRQSTENWNKPVWALKMDISNFFVSIDRALLWQIVRQDVGESTLTARLLKQTIFHDPTINPIIKPGTDFSRVPKHKSLWHCPKGKGLPIGNLTSQFLSNVYLDGLDKYAKHVLKIRWYVRYVDDIVCLSHNREQLEDWSKACGEWLKKERLLSLHPKKISITPADNGIEFVGRRILPFRVYTRRLAVGSALNALKRLRKNPLDKHAFDSVQAYLGLMRQESSYNLRKYICSASLMPLCIACDEPNYTKLIKLI